MAGQLSLSRLIINLALVPVPALQSEVRAQDAEASAADAGDQREV